MKVEKFGSGKVIFNIVVGMHGNETSPVKGFFLLKKYLEGKKIKKAFQVIIANEEAFKVNKRFVEVDLNRCFPGNLKGCEEEKIAGRLVAETNKAEFNFDFHSTPTKIKRPYGIVSVYSKKLHKIMKTLGVNEYLFDSNESLIKFAPNSFAFEVGWEGDSKSPQNAFAIMKNILIYFGVVNGKKNIKNGAINFYLIYHFIPRGDLLTVSSQLADFKYVKSGQIIGYLKNRKPLIAREGFYPILVEDKIAIKKAKRITIEE